MQNISDFSLIYSKLVEINKKITDINENFHLKLIFNGQKDFNLTLFFKQFQLINFFIENDEVFLKFNKI